MGTRLTASSSSLVAQKKTKAEKRELTEASTTLLLYK